MMTVVAHPPLAVQTICDGLKRYCNISSSNNSNNTVQPFYTSSTYIYPPNYLEAYAVTNSSHLPLLFDHLVASHLLTHTPISFIPPPSHLLSFCQIIQSLPPPPAHYDYSISTEANYAIKGTSGGCYGSVRGTLQGNPQLTLIHPHSLLSTPTHSYPPPLTISTPTHSYPPPTHSYTLCIY